VVVVVVMLLGLPGLPGLARVLTLHLAAGARATGLAGSSTALLLLHCGYDVLNVLVNLLVSLTVAGSACGLDSTGAGRHAASALALLISLELLIKHPQLRTRVGLLGLLESLLNLLVLLRLRLAGSAGLAAAVLLLLLVVVANSCHLVISSACFSVTKFSVIARCC
jgi:hypothetical protein